MHLTILYRYIALFCLCITHRAFIFHTAFCLINAFCSFWWDSLLFKYSLTVDYSDTGNVFQVFWSYKQYRHNKSSIIILQYKICATVVKSRDICNQFLRPGWKWASVFYLVLIFITCDRIILSRVNFPVGLLWFPRFVASWVHINGPILF